MNITEVTQKEIKGKKEGNFSAIAIFDFSILLLVKLSLLIFFPSHLILKGDKSEDRR